jgi:branched-subunit amino acid transport protein AzlD
MSHTTFKIIVIAFLILIVFNLFRALYYLVSNKGSDGSTVKYLSWRIGLSMGLFLLLIVFKLSGLVEPHNLNDLSRDAATADEQDEGKTMDEITEESTHDGRVRIKTE